MSQSASPSRVRKVLTLLAALALLLAAAGTVAAGQEIAQSSATPDAQDRASIDEHIYTCSGLVNAESAADFVTTLVSPEAGDVSGRITQTAGQPVPLPGPGSAVSTVPGPSPATVTVQTAGDEAAVSTVRSYYDAEDEGRGLAVGTCTEPQSEWWFVGVSARPGSRDELLLSNPTNSPAVVSLDVFGPAGPIELVGVGGLVVQPGQSEAVRIDSLMPGVSVAALRVTTSGGLVSAAVRATSIDGLIPRGAEFIPPAAAPAAEIVVPGVLPGEGERTLVITAPGEDAAVSIAPLIGAAAPQQAAPPIPIPAGHSVTVPLEPELAGAPAGIRVTASAPVTAAVRSVIEGTLPEDGEGVLFRVPIADTAWTAAQPGLAGGRLLLPLTGVDQAPATLLVTSAGGDATATVIVRAASGDEARLEVTVGADATETISIPVVAGEPASVTVERANGTGLLHVAVAQVGADDDGPLVAAAIGSQPTTSVSLPPVYPDAQTLQAP